MTRLRSCGLAVCVLSFALPFAKGDAADELCLRWNGTSASLNDLCADLFGCAMPGCCTACECATSKPFIARLGDPNESIVSSGEYPQTSDVMIVRRRQIPRESPLNIRLPLCLTHLLNWVKRTARNVVPSKKLKRNVPRTLLRL